MELLSSVFEENDDDDSVSGPLLLFVSFSLRFLFELFSLDFFDSEFDDSEEFSVVDVDSSSCSLFDFFCEVELSETGFGLVPPPTFLEGDELSDLDEFFIFLASELSDSEFCELPDFAFVEFSDFDLFELFDFDFCELFELSLHSQKFLFFETFSELLLTEKMTNYKFILKRVLEFDQRNH